jgi:ferredoxin-NADP reductase
VTSDGSRLSPNDVIGEFGDGGLVNAHVVMCGPHGLLRSVSQAARDCGASTIHVEEFDIRSGIAPDLTQEIDDVIDEVTSRLQARKENQRVTQ